MQSTFASFARVLMFILAFGVAFYATRYWTFEVTGFLNLQSPENLASKLYRTFFYGHVIFGPIALVTGPIQFLPKFRAKFLPVHKAIGKAYIIACLLSGLAALGAAQYTPAGPFSKLGFMLLAISWLYTTAKAYAAIKRRSVEIHRRWMIRSYALTLAAVTLRLQLGIFEGAMGMDFLDAYQIVAWACWVPNWLAAELSIKWLFCSPTKADL